MNNGCECLKLHVDALRKENNQLPVMFSVSTGKMTRPYFQCDLVTKKRGERPMKILPAFCPFCGAEYPEQP